MGMWFVVFALLGACALQIVSWVSPGERVKPVTRVVRQTVVVLATLVAAYMVSMKTGFNALLPAPVMMLSILSVGGLAVGYRRERGWGAPALLATVVWVVVAGVIFSMLSPRSVAWVLLIPTLVYFMRRIEVRVMPSTVQTPPKNTSMHFSSKSLEVRLAAGGEQVYLRYQNPPKKGSKRSADVEVNVPALYHDPALAVGFRWVPNVKCVLNKETTTEVGNTGTSTFVPGQTGTAYTNSGPVHITTNGQWINTPGQSFTYQKQTGNFTARVSWLLDKKYDSCEAVLKEWEKQSLEAVMKNIAAELQTRCDAANAREKEETAAKAAMDAEAARLREAQDKLRAQQAAQSRKATAAEQVQRLLTEAGISDAQGQSFYTYADDATGNITQMLAADRSGRGLAVALNGQDVWVGHWNGAEAVLSDKVLKLRVSDDEYRTKHLKERRLEILGWDEKTMVEWSDRIQLLNGQGQA